MEMAGQVVEETEQTTGGPPSGKNNGKNDDKANAQDDEANAIRAYRRSWATANADDRSRLYSAKKHLPGQTDEERLNAADPATTAKGESYP